MRWSSILSLARSWFASFLSLQLKKRLDSIKAPDTWRIHTKVARGEFHSGIYWPPFILVFAGKLSPAIYNTTHIALILNNFTQLINTLQFLLHFNWWEVEFWWAGLRSLEQIAHLLYRRRSCQWTCADAKFSTPGEREMFQIESGCSSGSSSRL
jgi:hypothetical protein